MCYNTSNDSERPSKAYIFEKTKYEIKTKIKNDRVAISVAGVSYRHHCRQPALISAVCDERRTIHHLHQRSVHLHIRDVRDGACPYDTNTHWSLFGQIVIIILIQTSGAGIYDLRIRPV